MVVSTTPSAAVAMAKSRARSARARPASESRTWTASASSGCGPSTSVTVAPASAASLCSSVRQSCGPASSGTSTGAGRPAARASATSWATPGSGWAAKSPEVRVADPAGSASSFQECVVRGVARLPTATSIPGCSPRTTERISLTTAAASAVAAVGMASTSAGAPAGTSGRSGRRWRPRAREPGVRTGSGAPGMAAVLMAEIVGHSRWCAVVGCPGGGPRPVRPGLISDISDENPHARRGCDGA